MKNSFRLFIKDLKSVRREYALYLLFLVVLFVVNHFMFGDRRAIPHPTFIENILFTVGEYHTIFFFPGLLLYSFIREKISHTEYQNLFIPAGRGTIYLTKTAVVLSGLFLEIIITVIFVVWTRLLQHRVDPRVLAFGLLEFIGDPSILVSLVFLSWGAIQTVQRFRFAVGIAVFGVGFLLYRRIVTVNLGVSVWESAALYGIFMLALGVIYIIIGTVLYNRFADV